MIFSPWYDTDYGGEFSDEYLALLRKITFRPKTHSHKRYHTKGESVKFRGAETPGIFKKY